MSIDPEDLSAFPAQSRENWRLAAEKALAGASLSRFTATSLDGIDINPLAEPGNSRLPLAGRTAGKPWSIVGQIRLGDPARTNQIIHDELAGGADAIDLILGTGNSLSGKMIMGTDSDVACMQIFEGVYFEMISLHFSGVDSDHDQVRSLIDFAGSRKKSGAGGTIYAGIDPYCNYYQYRSREYVEKAFSRLLQTSGLLKDYKFSGSAASVRGQPWHALGASEAQQIAIALSSALAIWRQDGAGSPDLDIEIRLVADQNQLLTIAKLRAFRQLWALLLDELGYAPSQAFIHAEPAWRMMARRDPWTNTIRSTLATFASAVGGADAISSLPHTVALGEPDSAARRLARNVQTVLLEESNLHRVGDPSAGSAGIETLTDQLAEAAWDEFRRIEGDGGLLASMESGALFGRIAEMTKKRRLAIARRRQPVTGVSNYPLLTEGRPLMDDGPAMLPPLPGLQRDGEAFELLRDRSDKSLSENGSRPVIHLANIGPVAAFTTRANFAKNLFEAGGIETRAGEGGEDPAAIVASFKASGARLACLCSDDATYDRLAVDVATALKAAGAQSLCLAGRARDNEEALRAAGIDVFVYDGLDMLALLATLHDQLGSPAAAEATP